MTDAIRRLEELLAVHAQCGGDGVWCLVKAGGLMEAWCSGCQLGDGEENVHLLRPGDQEKLALWAIRTLRRNFELWKGLRGHLVGILATLVPNLTDAARERLRREAEGAGAEKTEPADPAWLKRLLDGLNARPEDDDEFRRRQDAP